MTAPAPHVYAKHPRWLYKHKSIDYHTRVMFRTRTLRFGTREELNDPYASYRILSTECEEFEFREHLWRELLKRKRDTPLGELAQIVRMERCPLEPSREAEFQSDYAKRMSGVGILTASEVNDSVVMWSHYADKHRGICLRLDTDKVPAG
jgi:hypothetical protein